MSGHSKWASIKHKKAVVDARRGKVFSKLAKEIIVAARDGGSNPDSEEPHGPYPIGIDADPDLSPDNKKIVFSRLKTGKENEPFGIYELITLDVETGEETVLDSSFANMIPEWKSQGIVFIRQIGSSASVMDRKQSMYIYKDGGFMGLEPEPYDIFPIGSNGASWMDL